MFFQIQSFPQRIDSIAFNQIFYDIGTMKKIQKLFNNEIIINTSYFDKNQKGVPAIIKINKKYNMAFLSKDDLFFWGFDSLKPIIFFQFDNTIYITLRFSNNSEIIFFHFKYREDENGDWKLVKKLIMD